MEILIIIGPPFSRMITISYILGEKLGYKPLSIIDRFRWERSQKTTRGELIRSHADRGEVLPHSLVQETIENGLNELQNERGVILNDYPRSVYQAEFFLEFLARNKETTVKAYVVSVPRAETIAKIQQIALKTREKFNENPDDISIKRLDIFESEVFPTIEYLKSKIEVISIDGMGESEDIAARILTALAQR